MKKILIIIFPIFFWLFFLNMFSKVFAQDIPNAPPNFHEGPIDITSIAIAWDKVSDITRYEVWYSTDQSSFTTKQDVDASFTQYTVSGLSEGSVYYIHLNACNGDICSLPTNDLRLQTKIGPDGIRYCDDNINSREYLAPYQTSKPICNSQMTKQECKDKNKRVDDVKSWYLRTDTFDGRRRKSDKTIEIPPNAIQDDFVTFLKEEIFAYHAIQPGRQVPAPSLQLLSEWYTNSDSPSWAVGRKVVDGHMAIASEDRYQNGPETFLLDFVSGGLVGVDTVCRYSDFKTPPTRLISSPPVAALISLPCDPKKANDSSCLGVDTAVGPFNTDVESFVARLFSLLLGLSGGIAVLLIIASGYQILTSQGNPEKLERAREVLTSTIIGLLFIIYSFLIFEIITTQILHIPGFI